MRIVIDFETTSTADLRKTGTHAYAEHCDTRVTVACFAVDNNPVETWVSGPAPASFTEAIKAGATVVAHNFAFEMNIYLHKFVPQGWPQIPLQRWSCTMARALVAGYPASLDLAGRALNLPIQKDRSAHDLMLRFARPRSLNPLVWWDQSDPARFQKLIEYCQQDVETERLLDKAVPELSPRERLLFEMDAVINQRGLGIDLRLVDQLSDLARRSQDQLRGQIIWLTNGQVRSLNQVAQLREWLKMPCGVDLPVLRRQTVRGALADPAICGPARVALQARLDASRSSTAKLTAITAARSHDGRVRGTFQYYGASRTGRWAGRRLQPQNLFRGSIKDVPGALRLIANGADPEALDLLFEDSALGVIASCLRSTITAGPLHRLAIADLSQIEARVLAWLAHQDDALEVFRRGDDIYTATAKAIGSPSRQLGKVLVLACGFGMGHERFRETALGYGMVLDPDEAASAVIAWRTLNHRIVNYWWTTHQALMRVTSAGPGAAEQSGFVTIIHKPRMILLRLPSGRHLVYRRPRIETNDKGYPEFTYMGSLGGGWIRLRAWPGKIVENITQAVARDVMAESMLALRDLPLIATVHDELVAEVHMDDADGVLDRMLAAMRTAPAWALGLPVDAAGITVQRYQKG